MFTTYHKGINKPKPKPKPPKPIAPLDEPQTADDSGSNPGSPPPNPKP